MVGSCVSASEVLCPGIRYRAKHLLAARIQADLPSGQIALDTACCVINPEPQALEPKPCAPLSAAHETC